MQKEEKLRIIKDLIKIESINGSEKKVADYLDKLFASHNISSEHVTYEEGRDSLVANIEGNSTKILGFTGHEDVVSPGNYDDWTYGPFNPETVDGKVYGRGSTDMKSGLAAMAIALIELNEDSNFDGKIRLLATVGEELGMYGSIQLAKEGYADDLDGLIVGEQSNATSLEVINQLIDAGIVSIPQPNPATYNRHVIYSAHKGSLNYTVKSEGIPAHSSLPQLGVNAIDNLLIFYNAQQKYFEKFNEDEFENDILGKTVPVNTIISGGNQPNTVPGEAELTVKIRTIPNYSNEKIEEELKVLVNELNEKYSNIGMKLTLEVTSSILPVYTPVDSEFANIARDVYKGIWHEDSLVVGATGGTDASSFVEKNPSLKVIVAGPGNETAHQNNEFVFEDDYLKYIEVYKKFAYKYFE